MIFLCMLVLLSTNSFSQAKKKKRLPPIAGPFSTHYVFGKKYKLSFSKRLLKYPFSQTAQIQLVSFNGNGGPRQPEDKIKEDMPQIWANICTKPFQERKTLTLTQIDRLSDILYNYGYIKAPTLIGEAKCYEPRNGILFLNENGKVFEFIEICFSCQHNGFSSIRMGKEEFEKPKFDLIRKFFIDAGIEYGITKKFDNQLTDN